MTVMYKSCYYLKAGIPALFITFFILILLIGPVIHNHNWQLVEPTQCPAFLLEQVLHTMVMFFLLVMLFNLPGQSSFFEVCQFQLKRFKLSFVQTNRPPPVTF
ncbi:MAG: hypothetical protein A2Y94_14730 [Caldithrix sp. RBG_13_44_9]|nr:MAG: hypothetical protein A2Y94_14730 [Caldithrix sp. RBG_13_44_9]